MFKTWWWFVVHSSSRPDLKPWNLWIVVAQALTRWQYITIQHDCLWLHVLVVMGIMGMCCSNVMDKLSELTCFLWLLFVEFWSFHMVIIRNSTMSLTTLVLCIFISQICFWDHKYVFHLSKVFYHLVKVILILLHPCFLPFFWIYWISVWLLMSHEKCPIWKVLFILKFGTFAIFFRIVLYSLQVHNGLPNVQNVTAVFSLFV